MKFNKNGAIEIQFNWIYIAVVGVIILTIFLNIAGGIRRGAQQQLAIEAVNIFDGIFTSLQGSEKIEHSITLPGLELELASDSEVCNYYSIKDSDFGRRSTEYLPVFGPDLIKKEILSYSIGWDVPFRANYFLYLTSPDIAYVFVGQGLDIIDLYEEMPDHRQALTKVKVENPIEFINQNYYKVKYISYTNLNNEDISRSVSKLKNKDVTALYINHDEKSVIYYVKNSDVLTEVSKSYYIDDATLFAAIYSDNLGSYECNLKKAVLRANKISNMLIKRIDKITVNLLPICESELSSYNQAKTLLTQLRDETKTQITSKNKMDLLINIKNNLQDINSNLNKKSCPTIY